MMNKIDSFFDHAAVWMLRAAAMGLSGLGALFLVVVGYVMLAVMPEMIVVILIGSAMLTASVYLWKKAAKVAAASKHLIL